jgi:hypothetical protein
MDRLGSQGFRAAPGLRDWTIPQHSTYSQFRDAQTLGTQPGIGRNIGW